MIEIPTLFVLGAGASIPYDFPSGDRLVFDVINGLQSKHTPLYRTLVALEHREEDIQEFGKTLRESALNSIDAFLESNTDFLAIGKHSIAHRLLMHGSFRDRLGLRERVSTDVYRYVFQRIQGGTTSFDRFKRAPIRWVTYNYDRSLEAFLQRAVAATYPEVRRSPPALDDFDVVHLHGHLGNSGWATGIREGEVPPDVVREAAKGIHIVHDDAIEDAYRRAHGWTKGFAEQIVMLGFGFHPLNLMRLELQDIQNVRVYATRYDVGQARIEDAQATIGKELITFGGIKDDSVKLLDERVRFVQGP